MSTELKTLKNNPAAFTRHFADSQQKVQVTIRGQQMPRPGYGTPEIWFSLTREEALAMASDLLDFATGNEQADE